MRRDLKLPRRTEAWSWILQDSGIHDHDYSRADAAFAKFLDDRARNPRPPVWEGGEFDAINTWLGVSGEKRARSALHAFYLLTRGAKSWVDVVYPLSLLRQVPGLERLRLPDEIVNAMLEQIQFWRDVEQTLFDERA